MIDDAMLSLNDALDELGKLRIRTNASKVDLNLTREEARACIDSFIDIMGDMVVPDIFTTTIDFDLLKMLPDIINSPYVNIEPGMYVLYFNALYYGLTHLRGLGDPVAQGMYLKILEAVPAWLESPGDTELDGHTAALMAWTATSNHDYRQGPGTRRKGRRVQGTYTGTSCPLIHCFACSTASQPWSDGSLAEFDLLMFSVRRTCIHQPLQSSYQ
jgi:hypothetical protein